MYNHPVMPFMELVKHRYSVRHYLPKPVEPEKLELILEAARLAPSSHNSQPWQFVVVQDKEKIRQISQAMPLNTGQFINGWIAEVPLVIVALGKPQTFTHKVIKYFAQDNHILDVAIAMDHMVHQATELGLGTCWIGWYDKKSVIKILGLPKQSEVVALLTIGYAADGLSPEAIELRLKGRRKAKEEITSFQ